jgi:hypothetical protein
MRSILETAVLITGCASAIFWFASAMCRLPLNRQGVDEQARIAELSKTLQKMSNRNFWAAGSMGVTALLAVWIRFLG